MPLIDPSGYVIATADCVSKGVVLHAIDDCPRDKTCPVWAAFHPEKDW